MEIIQQRLEAGESRRLVQTAPNVTYQILTVNGETLEIHNPQQVPDSGQIEEFRQPIVRVNFVLPKRTLDQTVMQLSTDRRGVYVKTEYLSPTRAILTFDLPLAEVIYDMHDKLKSVTRWHVELQLIGYRASRSSGADADILVGSKRVDATAVGVHDVRPQSPQQAAVVKKLRTEIDRHMFEIAIR